MKRFLALLLALMMVLCLTACGGGSKEEPAAEGEEPAAEADSGEEAAAPSDGDVTVTIFNTKSEINDAMVQMAEEYSNSHDGVTVEVYMSNDTVIAHMTTKYASGDPYTIAMVDSKDVYSLGEEHAIDVSDQPYMKNTTGAITLDDGKVAGIPFCVEARGMMYNATAIEAITGETFDPASVATLDDFTALLDKLVDGGMEAPVGIMKEDWSLAAHYLAQFIEERDDVDAFVEQLKAGEVDLANDAKFNSLMDTFDTLMKYNYAASSPVAAEREVSEQKLAEGEIAFMFGGNWDWSQINVFDYDEGLGMMPLPLNDDDGANTKLVGGPAKMLFVEASDAVSDAERTAALDFLNWLFTDEEGNKWITEDFALVPAFSNINADALDPLSLSVKEYSDAGNLIPSYNYMPDDHITRMGAEMQKYLAGQCDRAALASAIESYWTSVQ